MTSSALPLRRRVTPWLLLALLIASGIVGAAFHWFRSPAKTDRPAPPPVDPRLAYSGPFRNIHPDVRFVGDTACASCHADECDLFHQHAMGRSILSAAEWL